MELPPPIVIALDDPLSGYHAWTSYVAPAAKWGAQPVTIAFAGEPPLPDARALLDVAARSWSVPSCTAARFVVEADRASGAGENGVNDVIVHRTDWPAMFATGSAGHTVLYTLGDKIVEADIHLNARDFTFTIGAAPPAIDLQAILTHELGHVLGIGHSEIARATMSSGLLSGIAARSLEKDDLDAVCAMYPGMSSGVCSDCPAGFSCVGFTCERPGEAAVNAAACAPATEVRRCEGAGDIARCIATSAGERCARPCPPDCGIGLVCVTIGVDDSVCLPTGATVDAGVDAAIDAPADGGGAPPATSDGCSCAAPHRAAPSAWSFSSALALAAFARRRAAARATRARDAA